MISGMIKHFHSSEKNRFALSDDELEAVCEEWLAEFADWYTGHELWEYFTADDPQGFPHPSIEEVLADGTVYVIATFEIHD